MAETDTVGGQVGIEKNLMPPIPHISNFLGKGHNVFGMSFWNVSHLPNMDTRVSFLETNCSVNASHQPNPRVPDGHGRLPANVDAVGS